MIRGLVIALFAVGSLQAKLSPLASRPDWGRLEVFQETITAGDFVGLLDAVYAPGGAWRGVIEVNDERAVVKTRPGLPGFVLRFAKDRASARAVPSFWRPRAQLPAVEAGRPLAGLRLAIDPGHLGGAWAKMEERWFQVGNSKPVTEGDMTLLVAKRIAVKARALGAEVFLTRSKPGPVTSLRPDQLRDEAVESLRDKSASASPDALENESERLFYRVGEIRRRARLVNETLRPDVVLCLHFNAEPWGNEKKPTLVNENHLHFLVAGALSAEELAYEDQRFDMLVKLLNRSFPEELAVTGSIAGAMAKTTGLPPYVYRGTNAIRVDDNPFVYARNLLANRLFECPVVYVEPYVMNNRLVFARIQAGDYAGTRMFGGVARKSIYREYADAIVEGLVAYYSKRPL
jgi:N-acetylmuramoyl-L-alanine amidase